MAIGMYQERIIPDNNPSFSSKGPKDDLNGEYYPEGKFDFVGKVEKGESPCAPDTYQVTANGVSKSRGQGNNAQYNWGDGLDGEWNQNRDWKGGNMTGQ